MIVPFYKPGLSSAEINEVADCLRGGWLTTGPKTKRFEADFGIYIRQKHAVALNSCTAALHLALEAIGVKSGDVALVPTMTFAATAEVVRYFNATPLLVDCRESDFNLDVADAERRVEQALADGRKVVAVLPVHYGGQIGDQAGIRRLASRYGLKVIEDAAHCCPAYYREENVNQPPLATESTAPAKAGDDAWKPVGSEADITCFSFYANKCITTGEGGMACTQRDDYAERMRIMALHGISKDAWKRFTAEGSWYYEIVAPGFKYNLTDIASAIGIHQLRRADELHLRRVKLAAAYSELLGNIEELILPRQLPDRIHSWHLYVIRLRLDRLKLDRAAVIDELKRNGITTSVHWMPLHMHPYYREKYGYRREDYPVAAKVYQEIITLPLYPDMTEAEVRYVCDTLRNCVAANVKPPTSRRKRPTLAPK
jgi:dTDP-4-amino-4,6-dideoxygalactose transaminase